MNFIIFSHQRHHFFWLFCIVQLLIFSRAASGALAPPARPTSSVCHRSSPVLHPSVCVSPLAFARLHSDPQSGERVEADQRSDQGLQFHLPLSFRHKPSRIALQAVRDR